MSDRICISSNGSQNFHISAEDLVDCCISCGFGCDGGLDFKRFPHDFVYHGFNCFDSVS